MIKKYVSFSLRIFNSLLGKEILSFGQKQEKKKSMELGHASFGDSRWWCVLWEGVFTKVNPGDSLWLVLPHRPPALTMT